MGQTSVKCRCVVIYMNLGPYHVARLRALTEVVPDIHAIELAGEQRLYPWCSSRDELGFPLTTLFPASTCEAVSSRDQRNAVQEALSRIDPGAVVVAGYREAVMNAAARWARSRRRSTILLSPTTYIDHPRKWWKEWAKGRLVRRYTVIAVTGERAADYVERLGCAKESVFQVGNVIDNAYFSRVADAIRNNVATEQAAPNLPSACFIVVSRLSPEKNLPRLLEAFAAYGKRGGAWHLVLLGSGPQEEELRAMARGLSMSAIHFLGWKSYEELPHYYARASCLVLPSISETWGLVVNEAMACGLPVLVSQNCGCVPELCRSGENGYTFDPTSVEELTEVMLRISSSKHDLWAFGQASRAIMASFTLQTWALRLKECIVAAERRGPRVTTEL